jgi:hypothetical protein
VRDALAKLVLTRLKQHARRIFAPAKEGTLFDLHEEDEIAKLDDDRRHTLVQALVGRFESTDDCYAILYGAHRFIKPDDIAWCFEHAERTVGDESRRWAQLAASLFNPSDRAHFEMWLQHKRTCAAVAEVMAWPEQVALGSPEAETMKQVYFEREQRRQRVEDGRPQRVALDPPASERVRVALERCLSGEPALFWWLLEQLRLDDDIGHHIGLLPDTLYDHTGWKAADEARRARIIEAARRYLRDGELHTADLMQREGRYVADRAPALAVHMLLQEDPAFLGSLDPMRWQLIAPFLLLAPVGTDETRRRSVELAYPHAAEVMRDAAMLIIERSKSGLDTFALSSLENFLDDRLADRIVGFLRRGEECPPEVFRGLMGWLLRHDGDDARKLAESIVAPPGLCTRTRLCQEVAIALTAFASDAGWEIVWPLYETFPSFGVNVLREVAHQFERRSLEVAKRLSDGQLGALLDWFLRHVPPSGDPDYDGAHFVGPDDSLRQWRDALVNHLRNRASASACDALRQLRDVHPECPWLRDVLLDAQQLRL